MNLTLKDKTSLATGIAWFAALLSLIVSVMLIVNYLQLKSVNPLESPALQSLVERLHDNPNDELLKENIRSLDLMIRKAYFTSQWQIRTGAYLLIFGVLIFVLAIRYLKSLRPGLEEMESIEKDAFLDKQLARKWLVYSGMTLFVVALGAGFLSNNVLDSYEPAIVAENQSASDVEVIEVLPVAETTLEVAVDNTSQEKVETQEQQAAEVIKESAPVTEKVEEPKAELVKAPVKVNAAIPSKEQWRENYPFFRGPQGDGIAFKTSTPEKFDVASGENVLWKVKIPKHGYNSPIVWNDKLFVSGADNNSREVYCYQASTGELLWQAKADQIPGSPAKMPKVTEDTGLAAPTMATNGAAVFALFGTGDILALDFSGKRLWASNLGVPDNHYGHSSSLIISKDKLIIQYDTNRGARVMALATADGSTQWETERDVRISWASPVLADVNGKEQVILTGEPLVAGYDPETGKELWKMDVMMGEVGPSVGYANGVVYAANEYATLAAIKLGETAEVLWEDSEYLPEVASPLAVDGFLIIATSYGVVACYDAKDGTKYWEQEYGDGVYASPVYADGKVYVLDMGGNLHVIKLGKEFQLVAQSSLGEKSVCSPVFANGKMYLRGFDQLYCIGK
ncbi:outer membrane protein assembly factor BamB family protein [Sunxiuqinia sp. sy24]|uniref:outer membrane protein assembly factor BamB family protein n=1 Tax=Sunxiuqinia sp. sy24 TaxID=3461495 RepID=UPI0040456F07